MLCCLGAAEAKLDTNMPPSQTRGDEGKCFLKSLATGKHDYNHCHHLYYNTPCPGTPCQVPTRLPLPPGSPAHFSDTRDSCRLLSCPLRAQLQEPGLPHQEDVPGPSMRCCLVPCSWPHRGTQEGVRSLAQSLDPSRTGPGPHLCAVE